MDNNENFFIKHKILIFILFLFYFVFLVSYYNSGMGLFFDIPQMFLGMIFLQDDFSNNFIMFHDVKIREFSNFLVSLPFNIWLQVFKDKIMFDAIKVFSLSYFIVHIFALTVNYFVARRTKRYDIATIAFAFYFLLTIPNSIWVVRELHIAILFYFAILSYFLSKEELGWKDVFPISLLLIYLFESFETTIILGAILFIASQLYVKKASKEDNLWHKMFIGLVAGLTTFYIPIRLFLKMFKNNLNLSQGASEWLVAIKITIEHIMNTNSLLICSALFTVLIICFYRGKLNIKSCIWFIPLLSIQLFLIFKQTGFYSEPKIDILNYSFAMVLIFPVIALILIMDYFKVGQNRFNADFYHNLIVVTCIYGLLNLSAQIYTSYNFNNYISYMKNLLNNSEKTIVSIPEQDIQKYKFLKFETCYGSMAKTLFLSDEYVIKTMIFPAKYYPDYSQFCMEDKKYTYFDRENNTLFIQNSFIKPKTKNWDVSPIVREFEKMGYTKD